MTVFFLNVDKVENVSESEYNNDNLELYVVMLYILLSFLQAAEVRCFKCAKCGVVLTQASGNH